MKEHG